MKIVHLPFYDNNPYQTLLMDAQRKQGHDVIAGGGGGNFFRTAMQDWKADALHFHWLHPYLLREGRIATSLRANRFLFEIWCLRRRGSRILWTIHNLANHDQHLAATERSFTRRFVKLVDVCFAHGQDAKGRAIEQFSIPDHKIHVIPHGNYIGCYPNTIQRDQARQQLGLPATTPVYLFLGRMEPYKGLEELIAVFRQHFTERALLLIAGNCAKPEFLKDLQLATGGSESILLRPLHVGNDELQFYFNAADWAVFPFRNILTSGSIVLAMSFGKSVIAPNLSGLREVLSDSGVVWFEPNSPDSLRDAINTSLNLNPSAGGTANLQRASGWSWDLIASQVLDLITNLKK